MSIFTKKVYTKWRVIAVYAKDGHNFVLFGRKELTTNLLFFKLKHVGEKYDSAYFFVGVKVVDTEVAMKELIDATE